MRAFMPAGKVPWGQLVSPMQVIYVVGVLGDRCVQIPALLQHVLTLWAIIYLEEGWHRPICSWDVLCCLVVEDRSI